MTDEGLKTVTVGAVYEMTRETIRAGDARELRGRQRPPRSGPEDPVEWLAARGVGPEPPEDEALRRIVLRARALRAAYLREQASGWQCADGPFKRGHDVIADEAAPAPYERRPRTAKEIPAVHVEVAVVLSAWLALGSTWWLLGGALGLGPDDRVLRAKVEKMVRRRKLDGCTCWCRGDFVPDGLCEMGTMPPALGSGITDELLPGWAR